MADLIYVTIFVAFTALCIAYISWCDHIIGPDDPESGVVIADDSVTEAVTP